MKNKLQYAYTISVFMGVLLTAYMMMNQGTSLNVPNRNFQSGGFRSEAQVVDPAVSQLLEMENALAKVPKAKGKDSGEGRVPTEVEVSSKPFPSQ